LIHFYKRSVRVTPPRCEWMMLEAFKESGNIIERLKSG